MPARTVQGHLGDYIPLGRRLVAICSWSSDGVALKVAPSWTGFENAKVVDVTLGEKVPGLRGWRVKRIELDPDSKNSLGQKSPVRVAFGKGRA